MILVGLTGGIGMGKSTAEGILRRGDIPTLDTDQLARELVEPGQPALEEIRTAFGSSVIDNLGRLARKELARIVFADPGARRRLETILHPRIREHWLSVAAQWRNSGIPIAAVVIPLLFETGGEKDVDRTICVACSPAEQAQRLRARGMNPTQMEQRIQSQMPAERKMALSDFVVWSEGSMEAHEAQLGLILARLRAG